MVLNTTNMTSCVKLSRVISPSVGVCQGSFLSSVFIPTRGFISLPIEWKRPERLPFNHPLKTGDKTTRLVIDMKQSPIEVEQSKEYENANELVKKLFTFEFLGRHYAIKRVQSEMIDSIKNHRYDTYSTEVQIARSTARIRNLLEHLDVNKDKLAKTCLNNFIQKRRRRIRCLRKYDYKRYEWLLEKLDLTYTPIPEEQEYVERKKSIRKLTDHYCDQYKLDKLDEYKQKLEDQRADFLRERVETMKWVRQEEIDCGVEPTISEEKIQEAVDDLEEHLKKLSLKPVLKDASRNVLAEV